MRELLREGRNGALLVVCDTPNKYEIVSCWNYNPTTESWGQGHYFTSWKPTEEEKKRVFEEATKHFEQNYL